MGTQVLNLNSKLPKLQARSGQAWICGTGSAFPQERFTQNEVSDRLGIENKTVRKLLAAKHIETRHLYLPQPEPGESAIRPESQEQLHAKFDFGVLDIGVRAAREALDESGLAIGEIDFLICVTSSGFRVPGVSSVIGRALGLRPELYRLDIVGMGCNAGMTALRTAEALARSGQNGLLLCCEINSAIYVRDESIRTGIVNSLFGDGASAFVLSGASPQSPTRGTNGPRAGVRAELLLFSSFTISEEWAAMRFDWNQEQGKWSFGLSKQIPFVVGAHLKFPVEAVLRTNGLTTEDIRHWSIHTGGAAVIEGAKQSLGISEHAIRHTRSVLRDYGIMAAMGPGATLEACLVRYHR